MTGNLHSRYFVQMFSLKTIKDFNRQCNYSKLFSILTVHVHCMSVKLKLNKIYGEEMFQTANVHVVGIPVPDLALALHVNIAHKVLPSQKS